MAPSPVDIHDKDRIHPSLSGDYQSRQSNGLEKFTVSSPSSPDANLSPKAMRHPAPRSPNPYVGKPSGEGTASELISDSSQPAQQEHNGTRSGSRHTVHREDSRKLSEGIKPSLRRSATTFNSDATLVHKKSESLFRDDDEEEKQQAAWGGVAQQIINRLGKPERVSMESE